jgi:hypothetical protein
MSDFCVYPDCQMGGGNPDCWNKCNEKDVEKSEIKKLQAQLDEANGYLFKALPYLNDEFDGYYGETSVTRFKKEVLKYLEKYKVVSE